LLAGCGDDDEASTDDTTESGDTSDTTAGEDGGGEDVTLRLGYFANVTHAPAVVGVANGTYEETLGDDVTLETAIYNSGTEAIEALFADAIDASFIGPNPAINGWAQSNGEALHIVSGSTSGGAALVVNPDTITTVEDLEGKSLATPSLGNTQDVALRAWLADEGYETDTAGGGDVSITPQDNADTLRLFQEGEIDGAWVPEPWATRLINEGGGEVLVDERDLWPDGRFVTTHLIVSTSFLDEHPDVIRDLLTAHVETLQYFEEDPAGAQEITVTGIEELSGQEVDETVIADSWENLEFTPDPIPSSLVGSAEDAEAVGLLDPVDLDGIYDLTLLNEVLVEAGLDEVADS
jgi:NitT/TauT family transport system substrate-binding protein